MLIIDEKYCDYSLYKEWFIATVILGLRKITAKNWQLN